MEYKNIYSKFTLQIKTKYKNSKIQAFLQGLLPSDVFSGISQKICFAKVSYWQNSDIRQVSTEIRSYTAVRSGSTTPATSTNGDIGCNS